MRSKALSLDLHSHPADAGLVEDPPSPTHSQRRRRRRSIVSIASGLKPAMQKLWPGSRGPATDAGAKDCGGNNPGAVLHPASVQIDGLGSPVEVASRTLADSRLDNYWADRRSWEVITGIPSPSRPAPPPPPPPALVRRTCSRAPTSLPPPHYPPPPIPELSPVDYQGLDGQGRLLEPPASPTRPILVHRRLSRTPVHSTGQFETVGVNRTSSVSTIARQYRELVEYPDDATFEQLQGVEPGYDLGARQGRKLSRRGAVHESPRSWRRSRMAPSPVSDDGSTLVGCEEESRQHAASRKPVCFSPPTTPPPERDEEQEPDRGGGTAAQAALRLQIGMDLLTRELASALDSPSGREGQDASGLQVWVMIEAYESLRDQISATQPQNEEARRAIDSWLEALRAIHRGLAGEAAMSDSEYED